MKMGILARCRRNLRGIIFDNLDYMIRVCTKTGCSVPDDTSPTDTIENLRRTCPQGFRQFMSVVITEIHIEGVNADRGWNVFSLVNRHLSLKIAVPFNSLLNL